MDPFVWYVATYGNLGLVVTHYRESQKAEYEEAIKDAEQEHRVDRLDSYIYGNID